MSEILCNNDWGFCWFFSKMLLNNSKTPIDIKGTIAFFRVFFFLSEKVGKKKRSFC